VTEVVTNDAEVKGTRDDISGDAYKPVMVINARPEATEGQEQMVLIQSELQQF
jgi:hypothetical protein